MSGNKFKYSEEGYGSYLNDSGFHIDKCQFSENSSGGLYIDNHPKPNNPITNDVSSFLEKFPMSTIIKDCEFIGNKKDGC